MANSAGLKIQFRRDSWVRLPSLAYLLISRKSFILIPARGRTSPGDKTLSAHNRIHSSMTLVKKHRLRTKTSLIDTLPEMVISALANHEDFVVTYETDPDTKKKSLYVMTGELITPDMLVTLKQQIERKKEEGNSIITRDWK